MRQRLGILLLCLTYLCSSQGWALPSYDMNDPRLRPSYKQLYGACAVDSSQFQIEFYHQAYVQALRSGLEVATLAPGAWKVLKMGEGLSPWLAALLQNPTTSLALQDCFRDDSGDEFAFVRNLLIADAAGKTVAASIFVVSLVGLGKVVQKATGVLSKISPGFSRKALISTALISSAWAMKNVLAEREKVEHHEAAPDIQARSNAAILETAETEIRKLQEHLASDGLDGEERASLEQEIQNWQILIKNFSRAS